MTTLSLRPSFAAQLSALVSTAFNFVREVKAAPAAARTTGSADVWALYRMTRGADAVSPAVARRLASHAKSN
ncbi:hypothetical protein AB2N08_02640 [Massilia aurea]|uniref:hypothetical protein n=1 Tax=Massilia aurea TaxID=373040 RepID=UPI0034628DCC